MFYWRINYPGKRTLAGLTLFCRRRTDTGSTATGCVVKGTDTGSLISCYGVLLLAGAPRKRCRPSEGQGGMSGLSDEIV